MMAYKYQNEPPRYNRLYLDKKNAKLSGVCAGIADYTGLDIGVARILTILLFFMGAGPFLIVAYVIMAWVLEPKPSDLFESKEEDEFWRDVRIKPKTTIRDVRHKFREIERRLRSAEAHVTSKEYNLKREIDDLKKK